MIALEHLLDFKAQNHDLGKNLLVGDLNARTGNTNFDFEEDDTNSEPDEIPSSHPKTSGRVSKDQLLNPRGNLLLDFLACNRLSLLNGNTLGDIFGEYTSVNYNDASVVDYMAVTPELLKSVL